MLRCFANTTERITCNSSRNSSGSVRDLNYFPRAFNATKGKPVSVKFSRTVTNVGTWKSIDKVIISNSKLGASLNPWVLKLEAMNRKLEFAVTV
ncbi:hypothetical protein DsansV1_C13g0124921 [Dioscorea sansibarensis]